jgi:YVTN family beta-propeller protein
MQKLVLVILAVIILFSAGASYSQNTKAYILSEGSGAPGSAKFSSYTYSGNSFTLNIFTPGNLGLYPDGIAKYNSNIFITEQGGFGGQGKIYRMDSTGLVLSSQPFGTNPYSIAVQNNKVYVTNGPVSKVMVLNPATLSTIKEITVGVYPQEILGYQNKVFVCNTSVFGGARDSSVAVINTLTDSVIGRIYFPYEPTSLAISNDGKLLVSCYSFDGKIYKIDINTLQIVDTYILPHGFDKDMAVDKNSDNVYYINFDNNIERFNLSTRTSSVIITNPSPFSSFYYGYNFDYTNNKHFVLDAKNFSVSGSLKIYGLEGNLEQTFTTGVAPRRVIFDKTSTVNVKFISEVVNGYELKQNYPNPFNPSTTIRFSIPKNDFVSLKVFNVNGREVENLINENKIAGSYEINFNASNLSSGVYFYRLNTSSFSSIMKMTLVK